MQTSKESQDAIHRISPDSSQENPSRFEELVGLLEEGTDRQQPLIWRVFTIPIWRMRLD